MPEIVGVGDEVVAADTDHAAGHHKDGARGVLGLVLGPLGVALPLGPGLGLVLGPVPVMGETLLAIPAVEAGTGAGAGTEADPEHQLKEGLGLGLALVPGPGMSEGSDGRLSVVTSPRLLQQLRRHP